MVGVVGGGGWVCCKVIFMSNQTQVMSGIVVDEFDFNIFVVVYEGNLLSYFTMSTSVISGFKADCNHY